MSGRLFIIANAGRSGSTFLYRRLQECIGDSAYVAHEDIPVQVSKPRQHNRAYDRKALEAAQRDPRLAYYLNRWQQFAESRDVIETGWTCYHLLPVLYQIFKARLHVVVLHRDPWSVALSRASMGNYHRRTWYDDSHEVSPNDPRSIAPHYSKLWAGMSHAEKCLYWWYVVYREIFEFLEINPDIPYEVIAAEDIFRGDGIDRVAGFLNFSLPHSPVNKSNRGINEVQRFMSETFPISDEYLAFTRHEEINLFANQKLGYRFSAEKISAAAVKYKLAPGLMPHLRHAAGFWTWRRRIGRLLRVGAKK